MKSLLESFPVSGPPAFEQAGLPIVIRAWEGEGCMPGKSHVTRVSKSVRSKLLLASCAALAGISATSALAQSQTFTVTSLNDSGAGRLRDAINQANAASIAAVIRFSASGSQINLSS